MKRSDSQTDGTDPAAIRSYREAMNAAVPSQIVQAAVAVLGSYDGAIRPIGSGTLLAVGEEFFVVSAAHVLKQAVAQGLTVGVANHGQITACVRNWMISGAAGSTDDVHDIGLYRLTAEEAARFASSYFVRIADVGFPADLSNAYFVICGFPSMWTTTAPATDPSPIKSKMLLLGANSYSGIGAALDGFDEKHHFLMSADRSNLHDARTGKLARFLSSSGHHADFPGDLRGVSGCSVWQIGDVRAPTASWGKPKLVGVETAVYQKAGAIRATRWNSVTTVLYEAFPSTRATLRMYEQMHR